MFEQLGQPSRIRHIGLTPGQDLDMAGVDQHQLELNRPGIARG
jgi:hypothetical protein